MVRQINPSLARLWTSHNARQYGVRKPLVLRDLSEKEQRILDYLEHGVTEAQLAALGQITGTTESEVASILDRLDSRLVKTETFLPELTSDQVLQRFSELSRLYFAESENPAQLLRKRRESKVFIDSLTRTGLVIAKALDASEIGRIITMDQSRIQPADTLNHGYSPTQLGAQRAKVAAGMVRNSSLELHSRHSRTTDHLDLAILIANDIIDPASYQVWMARDVPHLAICFDEEGVEVSHIVIPGVTPCLGCLELNRMQEPARRVIAPQLLALNRSNDDSSTTLFAAGMALNQTLNLIDSTSDTSWSYRLDRFGKAFSFQAESSNCGCRLAPEMHSVLT